MGTKETINADLKVAMRAKDTVTRDTLRLITAAIKEVEVNTRKTLTDEDVQEIIQKQVKQRRESISAYESAGRQELADPEKAELAVIEKYLPQMMSKEEVMAIAQEVVAGVDTSNPKVMGQIMGKLMPKVKGKADGNLVRQVVQELLA